MGCELCGNPAIAGKFMIEGCELEACKECGRSGSPVKKKKDIPDILEQKQVLQKKRFGWKTPESEETLVDNYAELIKKKREKMGLTQLQLAKMLTERESLINKIEAGDFTPRLDTAKKIGNILKLTLVEKKQTKAFIPSRDKGGSSGMTLGDFIEVRKK